MFKSYKIAPDIYWVGALEWNERYIHGITMPKGSTNNAYLILDEKTVLIDTCIETHAEELLDRISDVIDPAKIDILISNHSEKDHAGSIAKVLEVAKNAEVVTSMPKGKAILETYLGPNANFHSVKNGEELCIGKRTLQFVHTPMVHWPDNMVTYSPYDKILFSNDAFGQFVATSKRFDDEAGIPLAIDCATTYFANILTPYTKQVSKAVDAVKQLDIDLICPAHGVIWRSGIDDIIGLYDRMCSLEVKNSAVVAYSSMYGTTERMALTIAEAFMSKGVDVRVYDIDISCLSDIVADIYFAKYVAVGSPTHNMTVLPHAGALLTYIKGLSPKGRIGIAFGSYGWMEAGQREIQQTLSDSGYEVPVDLFAEDWNDNSEAERKMFDAICNLVDSQ